MFSILTLLCIWNHFTEYLATQNPPIARNSSEVHLATSTWDTSFTTPCRPSSSFAATGWSSFRRSSTSPCSSTSSTSNGEECSQEDQTASVEMQVLCQSGFRQRCFTPHLLEPLEHCRRCEFPPSRSCCPSSKGCCPSRFLTLDMGDLAWRRCLNTEAEKAFSQHQPQGQASCQSRERQRSQSSTQPISTWTRHLCDKFRLRISFLVFFTTTWSHTTCPMGTGSQGRGTFSSSGRKWTVASCEEAISRSLQSSARHTLGSGEVRACHAEAQGDDPGGIDGHYSHLRRRERSLCCRAGSTRCSSSPLVEAPGIQRGTLGVAASRLREAEQTISRDGRNSQISLRRSSNSKPNSQSESWQLGCSSNTNRCHTKCCRGQKRIGIARENQQDLAELLEVSCGQSTYPGRRRCGRSHSCGESSQAHSRAFRFVKLGSVTGRLRRSVRAPNLHVHWADGYDAAADHHGVHDRPQQEQTSTPDRPLHSICLSQDCTYTWEAIADAGWMASLCLRSTTTDEIQRLRSLLSSPSDPQQDVPPQSLTRCDLHLLDEEPCHSIHDRYHRFQQPKYCHILYRCLMEFGQVACEDEGPILQVMTWLLHGHGPRTQIHPRRLRLDRWFMNWKDDIYKLWTGQIDDSQPFQVYIVQSVLPQHPAFEEYIHVLIVQEPAPLDIAIMRTCIFDSPGHDAIGLTLSAAFSRPIVSHSDLVRQFDIEPHCILRDCTFQSDTTFLHPGSTARMPLQDGQCVHGHLAPFDGPNEIERDDSVLMQTFINDPTGQDMLRLTQLMPRWEQPIPEPAGPPDNDDGTQNNDDLSDHDDPGDNGDEADLDDLLQTDSEQGAQDFSYLYRKTHGSRVAILYETEYDNLLLEVANVWNRNPDEVRDLHAVAVLPERVPEHAHCYITEMQGDRTHSPLDKLILVDVEFCYSDPARSMRFDRRVRVIPALLTRFRLLYMCHLSHHCLLEHERRIVFHNGNAWKLQDQTLHQIHDGDYLRIVAPPSEEHEETSALCWRRQKRINPDLITDDEIGSCCDEEGEAHDEHAAFQIACWTDAPAKHRSEDEVDDPVDTFVTHIDAAPEPPALPLPLRDVPHEDAVRDELYQLWDTHGAIENEDEGKVLYVHTWFLNHELHPECWESRTVRLCPHPMLWLLQIANERRDLYNPAIIAMWDIVRPGPPAHAWETAAPIHITLQQQRLPRLTSILISVMDNSQEYPQWHSHARALEGPSGKTMALHMLQFQDRCFPELSSIQCVVLHNAQEITDDGPLIPAHGHGLLIILNDRTVRTAHAHRDAFDEQAHPEEVSLLQRPDPTGLAA